MNHRLLAIAFFIFCCNTLPLAVHAQHAREIVYAKEYATKKPGKAPIVFLIASDSFIVQEIYFNVYYSRNGISQISQSTNNKHSAYRIGENGSIVECNDHRRTIIGHTAEGLVQHHFYELLYPLIHTNYLALTNEEKLQALQNLAKKYPMTSTKKKSS